MSTDFGTKLYFTHELSHMTGPGLEFNAAMYDPASPGGSLVTEEEFRNNEAFANSIGRAIASAANQPYTQSTVPYGFYTDVTYETP